MNEAEKKIVVELNNVYLKSDRGDQIFSDMSLKVDSGRSVLITGPAGSGKSSLVGLLLGMRFADEGSVEIFGERLQSSNKRRLNRIRRRIGGIGGLFQLIPSYTVAENIMFPLLLDGYSRKVRRERLMKMLAEFSLLKQTKEYPHALTRVENSMVQLARASIAHQPLMIIDEPLAGLDQNTYKRVLDFLVKVAISGRSMIIVASDRPVGDLPNTDYYEIMNGALQ